MKNNKTYTINDLREGRVAVINDGTVEELRTLLALSFPDDSSKLHRFRGIYKYYFKLDGFKWFVGADEVTIPTQSVKVFIEELSNVPNETKVTLTLENCEFVRCIGWSGLTFEQGDVYTKERAQEKANNLRGGNQDIALWINTFSPIPEEEYVGELIKIWKGKYPEIKESDHFSYPLREGVDQSAFSWDDWRDKKDFDYRKSEDRLFHKFLTVYQNGVWAEKVTCEDSAQTGETQNAYVSNEPLATLTSFKSQYTQSYGITFEPVIDFAEGVSFDGCDLAKVIEGAVNEYLNKQAN